MNAEDEMNNFVADAIDFIEATMTREELQYLLVDDASWQKLVTEAHLSREEADALREGLNSLNAHTKDTRHRKYMEDSELMKGMEDYEHNGDVDNTEDKDWLQKEKEHRERFLKEFPHIEVQLEKLIAQLRALADKADSVHRKCTIAGLVATSTGILSSVLTFVGLTLAPVTSGVSLTLSTTGLGLGTAASVTKVSSSIVDHLVKLSVETQAKCLESEGISPVEVVRDLLYNNAPKILSLGDIIFKGANEIMKNANTNPKLADNATCLPIIRNDPTQSDLLVQEAFEGTSLTMNKGVQILGMGTKGLSILLDVVSLMQTSNDLQKGTKTEIAKTVRQRAKELEKMLEDLKEINEYLQMA